ncbi:hypothetical protein [Segatella oris]|uniref:hypothetical protein n=1 Tax=Segatella oris TaxID=28135 RepID=UPI00031C9AF6
MQYVCSWWDEADILPIVLMSNVDLVVGKLACRLLPERKQPVVKAKGDVLYWMRNLLPQRQ